MNKKDAGKDLEKQKKTTVDRQSYFEKLWEKAKKNT